MNTKLLFTTCCLVTLAMPLTGFAQDEEAAPAAAEELTPCEQAAKDLELASQEEVDAYIADCEKAHEGMPMEDAPQESGSEPAE